MDLFEAAIPSAIADAAVLASFFDDKVISKMVAAELKGSKLTARQQKDIALMCNGAATMFGYFANVAVGFATAIFSFNNITTGTGRRWATSVVALVLVFLVGHIVHISRGRLSDVDEKFVLHKITIGFILRFELLILNVAIFMMLAFAIK